MEKFNLKLLYSEEEINRRVREMAWQISSDYNGRNPLCIGILKGVFIFMADLVRNLAWPVQIDFVRLASYGSATESCGLINITKDVELPVTGKDILIVEDIVDTGLSLNFLKQRLLQAAPASLRICVLIDKWGRREQEVGLDYVGFSLGKGFLVGYGLDCAEKFRTLPAIYEVEE